MRTLVSTYSKGTKCMGSVKKFGNIPPGLSREPVTELVHDSVRRKKPGPIHLTFSLAAPKRAEPWAGAGTSQLQ